MIAMVKNSKKWMGHTVLVTMLLALLIVSCSNPYQKEISTVTKLQQDVEECEQLLEGLDAVQVREMIDEYGKVMAVIKEKYIADSTVDQRFGRMANLYKGVKRSRGFEAGKENLLKEIAFTKTQLENLRDDLENEDITNSDTAALYLEMETTSVNEIKIVAEKLHSNFETLMSVQDTVYPYMQSIVDSLNKIR
ncbi:MAG TPA: hypothetical protein DCF89_07215 [Flavobacteriales bacterium]|nr:hypothetical protein [Flavobacteriales bacterium]